MENGNFISIIKKILQLRKKVLTIIILCELETLSVRKMGMKLISCIIEFLKIIYNIKMSATVKVIKKKQVKVYWM